MKKCTKIIAGAFLALIAAPFVIVFACPRVAATRNSYFDTNNGRLKIEYVSFGRVYRQFIEETEYSKLLKKFGFEELPPEWKPANSAELGIRRLLETQHVHHQYAKLPTDAMTFALWLQLLEGASDQEKREQLEKFRTLLRDGTPDQIHQYVMGLQQNAVSE
ncbi:MAG: hypothetical protein N2Z21_04230 [Candidatus Sumerlaeaceae bacterium]|nr:hypothetical protein [Candidatus Sumerlaeaceae bacterium]